MKRFQIKSENKQYVKLGAPLKVYYDITTNCNLNCIFCFKGKCSSDVTWEKAKSVITKIADANIPNVVFIGGEPMCCPFLYNALQYAKDLGVAPGIITNGTLFTDENASKLKKLVNNSISVSIHAPNDELHSEISRKDGVYSCIIDGLKILNKYGIVPEISYTPVKINYEFLYSTISSILNNGIKISDVLVNRLIPFGNALDCWCDKAIDYNAQIVLLEQMERLSSDYPNLVITTGDALPFCMFEEKYRKFITRCDYAITLGWINETNLFGKCMVRGSTGADNIDSSSIREVWNNSQSFLGHRNMCNLPKECETCDWLFKCGGGCSCSGLGDTNEDAYFINRKRFQMPTLNEKDFDDFDNIEMIDYSNDSTFKLIDIFPIRKERESHDIFDEAFLLIPMSSGAIIQDIIEPNQGTILWICELEKQIILYIQQMKTIFEIARCISYEFNMSLSDSIFEVKKALSILKSLNMVKKK